MHSITFKGICEVCGEGEGEVDVLEWMFRARKGVNLVE
jgi:hypothetical protein